ncbi:ankyrin repeat domain-containing protein [Breznakiella homolactica]|uniref:Ankyrin repeat domain-containing protein n=1 Tax=Breznakiella homolactica TaxID=2798577 RepID=A0A7T8B8R7_9SPIR|nr:ankyrin repeat domain-containing protein [Breznakiella homolactica]QQO07596.1 ankyrin repeat domain-containing protein [Breznakiella homolactica]
MEFNEIRFAYDGLRRGQKTYEEIHAMYKAMPDKTAAYHRGDTLLHTAAAFADAEAVQYLLEQGADANKENEDGKTPLWMLASFREIGPHLAPKSVYNSASALLGAGANAMKKDEDGNWIYLAAAKNGSGEFIQALGDKGVRITRADGSGNNGLHLLIESLYNPINNCRQAEERLKKDEESGAQEATLANDRRNYEEYKAVMEARLEAAFAGAKALLDAGVDPEDKNNMGETAHVLAQRRGTKKIAALMAGEITGDEEPSGGNAGGPSEAELRAAAGGMTIIQAAGKKDHDAIRALVQLGAGINEIGDIYGYGEGPALAMACRSCDYETVRLLLELGADPNLKAGNGTTPISWLSVSQAGNIQKIFQEDWPSKLIGAMVKGGMDINSSVNDKSDTFLTWALRDSTEMEMFLMKETLRWLAVNSAIVHGADVNRSNGAGQTPLMLASIGNPDRTMRMADEIQYLILENDGDVAARDKNGDTPLHYAARNGNEQTAKVMAENLFDFGDPKPDTVNNAGKTALDYATEKNNEALVKFLLSTM